MSSKKVLKIQPHHLLGFSGNVIDGLCLHPTTEYIIYPISTDVVIHNIASKEQHLLENDIPGEISAIACSNSGNYIAAGYLPYPGFKAIINVFNFHTRQQLSSYESHKDKVHSLRFSLSDDFLISVGGYEEDNSLICYSIKDGEIYCGSNAASSTSGDAFVLRTMHTSDYIFVTGGENTIRLWKFYPERKYLEFADVSLSKYKRRINCFEFNEENTFLYCGTNCGDVLKIKIKEKSVNDVIIKNATLFGCFGKKVKRQKPDQFSDAERYVLGINTIQLLGKNSLLIGSGNGMLEIVEEKSLDKINASDLNPNKLISPTLPTLVERKKLNIGSRITTGIVEKDRIFVGTEASEILSLDLDLHVTKLIPWHNSDITEIIFPSDYSEVFATASNKSIEIWSTEKCDKLLSINVAESACNGIRLMHSGAAIVSIWEDGRIRIHTPETGKLIYQTKTPFKFNPTTISININDSCVIIGDFNGEIFFWEIKNGELCFISSCKEHTKKINSIDTSKNGLLAVSAGNEGLCAVWNLNEYKTQLVFACLAISHTVKFHPNGDIFTCGEDRKIRVWSITGCLLKEIEVSRSPLSCLDLTSDGKYLAVGGSDMKLWSYENECRLIAVGQFSNISQLKFSPDQNYIVAVYDKNKISVWKLSSITA